VGLNALPRFNDLSGVLTKNITVIKPDTVSLLHIQLTVGRNYVSSKLLGNRKQCFLSDLTPLAYSLHHTGFCLNLKILGGTSLKLVIKEEETRPPDFASSQGRYR
jgi:hypothetical protein